MSTETVIANKTAVNNSRDILSKINPVISHLSNQVVGQHKLLRNALVALLVDGHMLIEGMPGLAKTRTAKLLAQAIAGKFQRIQFTPDLLPADITGTDIYLSQEQQFKFIQGPIFNNIVLADEINRAPAKVQSALLEAMEEKQVTIGKSSYKLPEVFMVIATQNSYEQEGTYPLAEAQVDRFLLHCLVDYPSPEDELAILQLPQQLDNIGHDLISLTTITQARNIIKQLYVNEKLLKYCVSIVQATRNAAVYDKNIAPWIEHGASPRATLGILSAARALAFLDGAEYVLPEHIQDIAVNVLRHRIQLSFQAQVEKVAKDEIISQLLRRVAVP